MYKILFILILTLNSVFAHGRIIDTLDSLSVEDQEIYLTTFHKCRSLSQYGAWWVGIDTDVALGNFLNLANIVINFDGKLLNQRIQQGLKSPQLYRKINSKGYHLALSHCFKNQKIKLSSNLAYQSVLVSLYATEIATTAGFAFGAVRGAPVLAQFMLNHKIAAAVLIMAQATVQQLTTEHSTENPFLNSFDEVKTHRSIDLSTMTSDNLSQIKAQLIEIKSKQLVEIKKRLESSSLTNSEEERLRFVNEKLIREIQELKAL